MSNCHRIFFPLLVVLAVLGAGGPARARAASPKNETPAFRLKWFFIADSATKVAGLKAPMGTEKLVIADVPLLTTKEFADFVNPYIGQPVTADLVERVVADITAYIKRHGQQLVYVTIPQQNIADGALRIVTVLGHYNLSRLFISDSQAKAAAMTAGPGAGQIVVEDEPLLANQEFGTLVASLFGRPITEELLDTLVGACTAYARQHGAVLAAVQLASPLSSSGEVRLAVIFGSYPLRRIIIADTEAAAIAAHPNAAAGPVVAENSALFGTKEFAHFAAPFIGRPITPELIENLKKQLLAYARAHDRLLVDVPVPVEDLATGELRFTVVIGRYNQLVFKGNKWFSNRLLASKLGIKPGDEVRVSTLENAIDWANQNPFRQVTVLINTVNKGPDVADLDIAVAEHAPVRVAFSYDDTGVPILGENHYTGSVQFGNLWGLDHQASYQFTTTDDSHAFQAHALDYRVPLPWRDYLQFDAAYYVVRPSDLEDVPDLDENGRNVVLDLKYVDPLKFGHWSVELSAGVDYKQVNTNLEFGDFVFPVATYDIAQFTGGATAVHRDTLGSWTLAANLDFSPGNFNSRNTDDEFNAANSGRQVRYVYAGLVAQRATALPDDFQWVSRGQLQLASTNLQGSEELTIGGASTVRGYEQGIYSGDRGGVVNQEIRGPASRWHLPFLPKNARPLEVRPLIFWDYARVFVKNPYSAAPALAPIESAGVGIRAALASNFSLSADYGWQILEPIFADPRHDRGDIQFTLAY
jgi:hemolysin activation/secretion protein